ncbi:MAG: glycoside hydrolase family 5 protein [Actinomycetota bacterium]|nr:glycoside hydrolase family 5 protein [Actinomycetota bacterium]MDQ6945204.1 glycoside hydrolase family 5 protein [Actinomycetota bacterium]
MSVRNGLRRWGRAAALVAVTTSGVAMTTGPAGAAAHNRGASSRIARPAATGMAATIGTANLPQVVRRGTTLRAIDPAAPTRFIGGSFRFTGVNAYEVNSLWSMNVGCGPQLSDTQLDALFSGVGPNSVMRVWFFQQMATNKYSGTLDWSAMDRTVAAARAHGVRLIATLGNQDGTCDDGAWKDPSWYRRGYATAARPGAFLTVSYLQWVRLVTARYATNPAILAWEPVNEPRPDTCSLAADCWSNRVCPDPQAARSALRSFFNAAGAVIRSNDPNHLISDGAPPVGGCGTLTYADLAFVDGSSGIDLVSYHQYDGATPMSAVNVAAWSALTAQVSKPLFAGENGGLDARPTAFAGAACPLQADRSTAYANEISTDFAHLPPLVGWLFWNAMPPSDSPVPACNYATWPGDPLAAMLRAEGDQLNSR